MIATPLGTGDIRMPRYACCTSPVGDQLRGRSSATVFEGIANPTPSDPPDSLSICASTPITPSATVEERPAGVSVVDGRVRLDRVRDRVGVRRGHLAMERADDPAGDRSSSPNGLPNASTWSPTRDRARIRRAGAARGAPAARRRAGRRGRSDGSTCPRPRRRARRRSRSSPEIDEAPATTCWLVTMCPFVVDHEPGALRRALRPPRPEPSRAAISTTAFEALS